MTSPEAARRISFSKIKGWAQDDHAKALDAFKLSAQEILDHGNGFKRASQFGGVREDWLDVCRKALVTKDARAFFENEFQPILVKEMKNLFTGYYEPQVRGRLTPDAEFHIPLYSKPNDLVAFNTVEQKQTGLSYGRRGPSAYFTRAEIEQGALAVQNLEICYLDSWIDAFFIHIQGNGRVLLPDDKSLRLSFAGKNGHTYKSIGRALLDRGVGTPETMSMQFLRHWLSENPTQAQSLLWENPSFVFFKASDVIDTAHGAIGAGKVPLTPLRSLAVDRAFWAFGTPLFLSTRHPPETGAAPFNHLMIAQDTGSAIKGVQRGDIYWGWGAAAEANAGHMKQTGEMVALLPKPLAQRLSP